MTTQEVFNQSGAAPDLLSGLNNNVAGPVSTDLATSGSLRIPVIAETLDVSKRVVETGQVRLLKTIHEEPQNVAISLVAEQVDVERVAMDRVVEEIPATRQEGDTMIYPVLKEEYIVIKRLRLIEEIRVTKRQVQTTEQQTISLRREEIRIERTAVDATHERSDLASESTLGELSL